MVEHNISLETRAMLDVTIGTAYILEAIFAMLLHVLCGYLMYTDKEMQNPTYYFMVNLSIVDFVELIALGIYPGIIIMTKWKPWDWIGRIASFLSIGVWYSNCVLFVLIAFSRWIAITRPHMTKIIFTKRAMWVLQVGSWMVCVILAGYANLLYPPGPVFPLVPELYTWEFDMTIPLGAAYMWVNFVFNAICTLFEMSFNILSLIWVHQTRKEVRTLQTAANRKREVQLLYQCFILGLVFTATYVIFTTIFTLQITDLAAYVGFQWIWTLNHSINPMVYLTINRKLRNRSIETLSCGKFGSMKTEVTAVVVNTIGSTNNNRSDTRGRV